MSANDLSTYYWLTDSDILSNKSLPLQIYFDSNTQKDKKYERFLHSLKWFHHLEQSVRISRNSYLDWNAYLYVHFERQVVVKTTLRRLLSTLHCGM